MSSKWMDQSSQIREGEELDLAKLEAYLKAHIEGWEGNLEVEQFPRGFSNLTYLIKSANQQFVLRRPPFGANIKSGHDMSREYRILSKLHGNYAKVPRPFVYCDDESVIGADFYVMERVNGVILRPKMPKDMYPAPEQMNAISQGLIESFAELHAVDYRAVGLGELGKPEGYVRRQIEGWTKRYQKAKTDDVAEMDEMAKWLAGNMPAESDSSLIHNDFKYDNMVLDPNDWSKVIAVLDWEMATLGDPLLDLGTSLAYWMDPDDPPEMLMLQLSPTTIPGNPKRAEVAESYAKISGRDIGDVVYYYVFGMFKIAVIVQQIYYRFKKGHTKDPRFAHLNLAVKGCGVMGMQAIRKNRIDQLFS